MGASAQSDVDFFGVRLPRLTPEQRDAIHAIDKTTAEGQTIFNTTSNCLEYWNGERWVSLCNGTANITLSPDSLLPKVFPMEGQEDVGPIVPIEEPAPSCGTEEPYTIIVVSGSSFITLTVLDASTGEFIYTVDVNTTARVRTGIIRITNNCTQEYKEFIVMQEAANVCGGLSGTPKIAISGTSSATDGKLCTGGATYLRVANIGDLTINTVNDLVWARNNVEVGRGLTYVADQVGTYELFLGGVGCDNHSSTARIAFQAEPAAPRPAFIDESNGGMICEASPINLTVIGAIVSPNVVYWYKNGDKEGTTGLVKTNITDIGDEWTVVVENPVTGCASALSNKITTVEGIGAAANITGADLFLNGSALSTNPNICRGGVIELSIGAPDPSLIYKWYVNGISLENTGSSATYTVPSDATAPFMISCQIGSLTSACVTTVSYSSSLAVVQPSKPTTTSPTTTVCAGSTLTLSTTAVAGVTYQWFDNGLKIAANATNSTYSASVGGKYSVQTSIGTCRSEMSDLRTITLAGAPTSVTFKVAAAQGNPDTEIPFEAQGTNVTSWQWSATPAEFTPAEPYTSVGVFKWANDGNKTVRATAINACGSAYKETVIDIRPQQMTALADYIQSLSAVACGSGAIYRVLSSYPDMSVATSFDWTVTRNGSNVPFTTTGSKGETLIFNYVAGSGNYTVTCIARGVGKLPSVTDSRTLSLGNPPSVTPVLKGAYYYCTTNAGENVRNIEPGNSYSYSIVQNYASNNSTYGGATYSWSVSDPGGLLTNAATIEGSTSSAINLVFGSKINELSGGGEVRFVTLVCVMTISGCPYIITKNIRVGDQFACGSGGVRAKVRGGSGTTYNTYEFPSLANSEKQCWMTEDSREGRGSNKYIRAFGGYSGDNGTGYWSKEEGGYVKEQGCPSANWHVPVGGTGDTEFGRLTRWIQGGRGTEKSIFAGSKPSTSRGYYNTLGSGSSMANWSNRWVFLLKGNGGASGTNSHETWINYNNNNYDDNGDASHGYFVLRCVRNAY
ncbi:hypothetical protein FACS189434_09850 [Bacteroidia bacterium]|nr:hypothetical protein FACS189434_09850 [Bacteroidia bacterium]